MSVPAIYDTLYNHALTGEADAGGVMAYNTLSAEPIVGQAAAQPVFTHTLEFTNQQDNYGTFRNNYLNTEMTIPAGTLKPGKLYFMGVYGGGVPYPGMEGFSGFYAE